MPFRNTVLVLTLALAGSVPAGPAAAQPAVAPDAVCRPLQHEGAGYQVCTADLRRHRIGLYWRDPAGQPYGGFAPLLAGPDGKGLLAAMNGGMYKADLSPVGLYVEGGREFKAANTANAEGNFHLKPNGVFLVAGGKAAVLETGEFLRRKLRAEIATQSGPMLVIGGRIHPRISEDGPSRKVRNGVGVRDGDTAVFAISDRPVSFGAFARLFRDALGCPDALFLDGSVSSLYARASGRQDGGYPMGPILGIRSK